MIDCGYASKEMNTVEKQYKLKNFRLNYSVHAILTFVTNNICLKATLKCKL